MLNRDVSYQPDPTLLEEPSHVMLNHFYAQVHHCDDDDGDVGEGDDDDCHTLLEEPSHVMLNHFYAQVHHCDDDDDRGDYDDDDRGDDD